MASFEFLNNINSHQLLNVSRNNMASFADRYLWLFLAQVKAAWFRIQPWGNFSLKANSNIYCPEFADTEAIIGLQSRQTITAVHPISKEMACNLFLYQLESNFEQKVKLHTGVVTSTAKFYINIAFFQHKTQQSRGNYAILTWPPPCPFASTLRAKVIYRPLC